MRFASEVGTKTEMAQIEQALGVAALDLGRVPYIPSYLKLVGLGCRETRTFYADQ